MTNEQLRELTLWMRKRPSTVVDKRYKVESDDIFLIQEREHSYKEKEAQTNIYDALTDGHHDHRIEEWHKGYRFKMEAQSLKGWVPHAFIYAWIKANGNMDMTPEAFWNIV
eukprot:1986593-Heterocapsa_arctica.AAC.1